MYERSANRDLLGAEVTIVLIMRILGKIVLQCSLHYIIGASILGDQLSICLSTDTRS